ncbi:MAG: hypothetical protein WAO52_08840 [Prolixibacteraceae bacterium]
MTNKDLITTLKAGYVIITPAGQSAQNLGILQELAIDHFSGMLNQSHIEEARDKMSNGEMIKNLPEMSIDGLSKASLFLVELAVQMNNSKSERYGEEIYNLMFSPDKFSPELYPNLNGLLKVENNLGKVFGKGGFFSKW